MRLLLLRQWPVESTLGTCSSPLNHARSHSSESVNATDTIAASNPSSAYQTKDDAFVSVYVCNRGT